MPSEPNPQRPRILAVDDIPENLEVIGHALAADHDVRVALSGANALELIALEPPDLICLDVMMPGMDGFEVLRRLRDQPATADIPVIFVTAKNDAASESAALAAGCADFIPKPINIDVLRARVSLQLALLQERRRVQSLLASMADTIAERTQALELSLSNLRTAKEAAEAANRAKTTFLATMSHELRTPMNAILGTTTLLARRITQPEDHEKLVRVSNAANQLMTLLNDVLDLSKIEADRLTLEAAPFRLDVLASNLNSLFVSTAQARGIAFENRIPDGIRQMAVVGDSMRLQQVLANLVGNALKFTDEGHVRVSVEAIHHDGQEILLQWVVEDSGIGIPPEALQRIFIPFEQADGSTTRRFGGTGLGLTISRQIAQLMGGDITVESSPGQGSRFTCTVRVRQAGELFAPADHQRASGEIAENRLRDLFAGRRILVVEDEPMNQEITRELLQDVVGLVVDIADHGQAALKQLASNRYDLVLMDMQMPVMDGLSATRQLRETPGLADLPVLALTANAFDADRAACLEAGMNDVITKPVDPDELFIKVLHHLGGSLQGDPGPAT